MHQRHPQFNVEVRLKILEDLEADPRHIYIYMKYVLLIICHVTLGNMFVYGYT